MRENEDEGHTSHSYLVFVVANLTTQAMPASPLPPPLLDTTEERSARLEFDVRGRTSTSIPP